MLYVPCFPYCRKVFGLMNSRIIAFENSVYFYFNLHNQGNILYFGDGTNLFLTQMFQYSFFLPRRKCSYYDRQKDKNYF